MKYRLINQNYSSNYIENILAEKGINGEILLNPTKEFLQSPEYLDNIDDAFRCLMNHIEDDTKFALINDSDLDGYSSGAILYLYIKLLNPNKQIDYFCHDGKQHGLEDMMENVGNTTYSIVFCPDSATNDGIYVEQIAPSMVICLDHHIKEENTIVPQNMIIVNNQTSNYYINKDLSGAGVTWQFCRYIDSQISKKYADRFIDLAALSISSDMMSVVSYENAYILRQGLHSFSKNFFFQTLLDKQSYSIGDESRINSISIAFYIVPLINALIRVGTQQEKRKLFEAFINGGKIVESNKRGHKPGETETLAAQMARTCINARSKQNRILEAAQDRLDARIHKFDLLSNKVLLIELDKYDDFPSELNGLLAMRFCAKYKRPTMVARLGPDGYLKGSARAPSNTALESFKEFLSNTGLFEYTLGHDMALGYAISAQKVNEFLKISNEKLSTISMDESLYDVNFIRQSTDYDIIDIIQDVEKYHLTYGQQNDEPLIVVENIRLRADDISIIGSNSDTLKFSKNGVIYIKFKAKDMIDDLCNLNEINLTLIGKANMNYWGGRAMPQIIVEEYELKDGEFDF